ncbi:MAG: GGDEF domain-containing protein [Deltaproteobacteria bacterium]|nr:GGDEF domain-containing protein [Deltaproteobacteria bacterium]
MNFDEKDGDDTDYTTQMRQLEADTDPTRTLKSQAVLLVMSGPTTGQSIFLETKDVWILGRSTDSDITLHDASVSRNHCKIKYQAPHTWIAEDLKSSNGTWHNGDRIQKVELKSGDKLQLGTNIILKFVLQDELELAFQKELYESATKDALTGLFSKRYFLEQLDVEFNFHKRIKKPISLVLCDLDHFKKVNDTYGHMAGDLVLKETGRLLLNVTRKGDLVGRYGGEEIIVLLRDTPLQGAKIFADKLRQLIQKHPYIYEGKKIQVTASFGVATFSDENYQSTTDLIKVADEFLYKAKQSGRNRVACLGDS